jgi:hypothetical protein
VIEIPEPDELAKFLQKKLRSISKQQRSDMNSMAREALKTENISPIRKEKLARDLNRSEVAGIFEALRFCAPRGQEISIGYLGHQDQEDLFRFLRSNRTHKQITAFSGKASKLEQENKQLERSFSKHQIRVEGEEVYLPVNGEEVSWTELKSRFIYEGTPEPGEILVDRESMKMQNTFYTYKGITTAPGLEGQRLDEESAEDLMAHTVAFDWQDPAKWNHQWVFSIKTESIEGKGRKKGDHAWMRLKTPDGRIFSFGLLRKGKFSYQTVSGEILRVDPREFFTYRGGEYTEVDFEIEEAQWKEVMRGLLVQARDAPPNYHFMQSSCVTVTKGIALDQVGLVLDVGVSARATQKEDGCSEWPVTRLFSNLVLWGWYGAGRVSPAHAKRRKQAGMEVPEPHFGFRDLFSLDKNLIDSPHELRNLQRRVLLYRSELRESINDQFRGRESRATRNELIALSKLAVPDDLLLPQESTRRNEELSRYSEGEPDWWAAKMARFIR